MLSLIEGRGQSSDQIFRFVPEKSHWSLRDKIYTGQHIKWNEESVLTVASVLKVRKYFASPTFSITLEMHLCFLSLRIPDDSFLELWAHDPWIRDMVSKSLTSSNIHNQDTGEHLLLDVYFLIYQKVFVLALQKFPLILPLFLFHEN